MNGGKIDATGSGAAAAGQLLVLVVQCFLLGLE